MKNRQKISLLFVAVLAGFHVLTAQTIQREVKRTSEKEVKIHINSSFGSVNISKGDPDHIFQVFYRKKDRDEDPRIELDYYVKKDIGDLKLELHPKGSEPDGSRGVHVNTEFNFKTDEWYVKLVEGIPLSIEAELGAGKNNFDFSGLTINDLSISTGASSSKIQFDTKNKNEIEEFRIETGVSKFTAENLNNANFKKLSFEGGVGSYSLDFGGELTRTVDVDVNVGLGAVTLIIPKNIGVKIRYEDSWLSNLSIDDEFIRKRKGIYESENYSEAKGRMNVFIESGLGSVKIRQTK